MRFIPTTKSCLKLVLLNTSRSKAKTCLGKTAGHVLRLICQEISIMHELFKICRSPFVLSVFSFLCFVILLFSLSVFSFICFCPIFVLSFQKCFNLFLKMFYKFFICSFVHPFPPFVRPVVPMSSSSLCSDPQRPKRQSAIARTAMLRRWGPRQWEATCVLR